MSVFKDVTLFYKGDEFTVKSDEILRLIAKVEGEISIQELTRSEGPPLSKLALAYTVALQYAGAKANHDEVYHGLFSGESGSNVSQALTGLLLMMLPPSTYQPAETAKEAKKPQAQIQQDS